MTVSPSQEPDQRPKNPTELEFWLQKHCYAGELSVNLTSFSGKKFEDEAKTIQLTDGSWYLFDEYREQYAEYSVHIINDHRQPLPCLNMLTPAGPDWMSTPSVDVDFQSRRVYERFLKHAKLPTDHHFYLAVRQAFGEVVFGRDVPDKIHDDYIAFSRQPCNPHKFHLVYIGSEPILWNKEEKQTKIRNVARFLSGKYKLDELNKQGPMIAAIPPSEKFPKGKPAQYWVTDYNEHAPGSTQCAAFIDVGAKGLRPLGSAKRSNNYNRDEVYHVYRLNCTPPVKVTLTPALFLSHLVVAPGQEHKRQKRKDLTLRDVGEAEAGASSGSDIATEEEQRFPDTESQHIRSWISDIRSIKSKTSQRDDEDAKSVCSNFSNFTSRSDPRVIQAHVLEGKKRRAEATGSFAPPKRLKNRVDREIEDMVLALSKTQQQEEEANNMKDNENFFAGKGRLMAMERHMKHIAATGSGHGSVNGSKETSKKTREPMDPCRPSNRRIWQGKAKQDLDDYVLGNKHLPWSKDLKKANWTIGRLAQKAQPPNLSTIMIALKYLGIADQVFTFELAIKMCAALTNQSAEFYAEILQYLVGTHNGKQGRIEVDGRSGPGLQWWMFNQKKHGWELQEGTNTYLLGALRGVFVAFRQYLTQCARKIDSEAPDAQATTWFCDANHQRHHPILLCYDEVMRTIIGQNGTRTCQQATQEAWERIIRNNCIVPGRSISQALNEDQYKVAFENGVFDLKKYLLRDGRPEDFTSYSFGFHYKDWRTEIVQGYTEKGEEIIKPEFEQQVKEWRRFFAQIFPIETVRHWIYRILTSCLGGMPPDLLYILTGAGSNGKSVFIRLLESIFGGYYTTISSSKLTERKGHSGSADPQTLQLKGKRVRADTEPEEGVPLNAAYIKARFDTQTARGLYEGSPRNQQHFYKHFLACNTIPPSSGDECNTRRQCVIPMLVRFSFDPNNLDKLDMKADEHVSIQSKEWRHTLIPYLLSLWQMYDAGNTTKSDPLNVFKLPKAVKDMNDRFKRESDFGLGFISRLKKSQYGFKSYDSIWNEYKAEHDLEFKTTEERRQNQRLSKVQMYRHLAREFGQPQVISSGDDAGEYYRCYSANDDEPTEYDRRVPQVHGSLGEQFAIDLDKVRAGDYSVPSNRGYERRKSNLTEGGVTAGGMGSDRGSINSSEGSEEVESSSSDDIYSDSSSDMGSVPEVTQKRDKKRKREEVEEEDEEYDFRRPTSKSQRTEHGMESRSQSSLAASSSGSRGSRRSDMSSISEISAAQAGGDLQTFTEKRKRKLAERLINHLAGSDGEMEDDHYSNTSNTMIRPRQRQRIDSDIDEPTANENANHPPEEAGLDMNNGVIPLGETGPAIPTAPRKKSRTHKSKNKFIDEGANVSDDDGEADEADNEEAPDEEDLAFVVADDEEE